MGWKTNVSLLAAVGGMSWYMIARGDPLPPTPPPVQLTQGLLPDSIWKARQVKIQRARLEPMILDLDLAQRKFTISDPTHDVASFALLTSIFRIYDSARLLQGYTEEELKNDPGLIAKIGLDKPRATVEVRYDGQTTKIGLGQPSFLKDDEIYLRVDEQIYRGPKSLFTSIQHNPDDLREKFMFTELGIGALNKVRITRRVGKKMVVDAVEKLPNVGYRVVEPRNLRVDMAMVEGLVQQVGALSIASFVSGTIPQHSQHEPDLVLAVEGVHGKETLSVFGIGGKGPQTPGPFLGRLSERNVMIEVSGLGLRDLLQWAGLLRARHLLSFGEAAIRRVEIVGGEGGRKLVLVRGSAEKFSMVEPVQGPIAATPVSELLFALAHMEAKEFVDEIPAAAGLGDGDDYLTLRVGSSRRAASVTIRLGRANKDGLVYARREEESTGVLLAADVVEKVHRPWLDFVGTQLPRMTTGAYCVEVLRPDGTELVYINTDGEWRLKGARPETDPDDDLLELTDLLRNVRASKAVLADAIPEGAKGVRVILRQQPYRNSAALAEYRLYASGKHVILSPPKSSGVVYLMRQGVFRKVFQRWR